MADSSITGLASAATIDGTEVLPVDQSGATVKVTVANLTPGISAMVGDSGSGGTKGLVPAPGTGDAAAVKFLKADATWAVPAGTAAGMVKIAKVVTSGSAATITFATISGAYTDLMIMLVGRDTATGSADLSARLKINSDATAGNYDSTQYILGSGATASANAQASSTAGGIIGQIPGSLNNAAAFGVSQILIPCYSGTTFQKAVMESSFEVHSATPTRLKIQRGFVWKSTAAITDLVITAGGTAFVDGTTAVLYGMG